MKFKVPKLRAPSALASVKTTISAKIIGLIFLVTASVVIVLEIASFMLSNTVALDGLERLATNSARGIGEVLSGADARTPERAAAELAGVLQQNAEIATAAVILDDSGAFVAASGEAGDATAQRLRAKAMQALADQGARFDRDTLVVTLPIIGAQTGAVEGALALQWSMEPIKASISGNQFMTAVIAVIVFLLAMTASYFVLRSMLALPLSAINDAMAKVAGGAFDNTIHSLGRKDEVGDIARGLSAFQAELAGAEAARRDALYKGAGFDGSSSAMCVVGPDGRIAFANGALEQLIADNISDFDVAPDNLVGAALPEVASALDAAPTSDLAADAMQRITVPIGKMHLEVSIGAVLDEAGQPIGAVVGWSDVTSRRVNRAIVSALDAQQALAEFGPDAEILRANAQFLAVCGLAEIESVTQKLPELVSPEGSYDAQWCDAMRMGGSAYFGSIDVPANMMETKKILGSIIPVRDEDGTLLRIMVFGTDVTDSVNTAASAEAAQAEMAAAQNGMISALAEGLQRLSSGDLTVSLKGSFSAEYEAVQDNFNTAMRALHDTIATVKAQSDAIQSDVTEITGATQDLSVRTERQAATLEQTAAALAQMTASVSSAAEAARRANDVVSAARSSAEASGGVVQSAVDAMGEIADSSKQISRIISVIDDIAFQTNLLALNAGVEAARAGDAGRGFAVVASEVRALAQRSSEAAREINQLISTSGEHVKRGVKLVGDAGTALEEIVVSVSGISDHVANIAASAQEQSSGLSEMSEAMAQLDQVTQQNAAMFEETTAASQALNSVADELAHSADHFTVEAGAVLVQERKAAPQAAPPTFSSTRETGTQESSGGGALQATGTEDAMSFDNPEDEWEDF
ncbi:MAG: PAS domain-containing protein [Alphaproteobacteria bacterium]|nr:PAS domain-containing protein [Alphaproteobacteria bacterium]NNF25006.1 PAS domain-containing protein [Paracoccaceae bacterium]